MADIRREGGGRAELRSREQELGRVEENTTRILSVGFSTDSRQIIIGSDDSVVRVWDVVSNSCSSRMMGYVPFVGVDVRSGASEGGMAA